MGSVARRTEKPSRASYIGEQRSSVKLVCATDTLIWCAARQRIVAALVQAMNFIAVEAFITNLHPRAERTHSGKLLDHKTNSLGRRGKSAIAEWSVGATFAFWHEQLGWRAVLEFTLRPSY